MNQVRWVGGLLLGALLILGFSVVNNTSPVTATASPPDEDNDDVRIEYEVKLNVPLDQIDEVWAWLQTRYADTSWLDQNGYIFQAAFGDEGFTDTYFDTPDLQMLKGQNGVRHRARVVHSGPAERKDGRQLLQLKLNRDHAAGLARSEIKFQVPTTGNDPALDNTHPLLSLIKRDEREEFEAAFRALDLNPYVMRPILTLEQHRRRIYLSDQEGAFATLTLDLCATSSWGVNLKWAEAELELDENRYTAADATERQQMEQVIEKIQTDVQAAFPAIEQSQTPKYNTAFTAIEATTWLPLRRLIQWQMSAADFIIIVMLSLVTMCGALWYAMV